MSSTKELEYGYLRDELAMNRKFVFERPLVIVGAALAASQSLVEVAGPDLLGVIFLVLILFSLWFTFNRLQSSARIVVYLQLIHEQSSHAWTGWERSLRAYRQWLGKDPRRYKEARDKAKQSKQYDHTVFYRPIYYLHLVIGIVTPFLFLFSSAPAAALRFDGVFYFPDIVSIAVNGALILIFVGWSFAYHPSRMTHAFEFNMEVWEAVFSEASETVEAISGDTYKAPVDNTTGAAT
jgi:hypothetical protein